MREEGGRGEESGEKRVEGLGRRRRTGGREGGEKREEREEEGGKEREKEGREITAGNS